MGLFGLARPSNNVTKATATAPAPEQESPWNVLSQILASIAAQYGAPQGLNALQDRDRRKLALDERNYQRERQSAADKRAEEQAARQQAESEYRIKEYERQQGLAPKTYDEAIEQAVRERRATNPQRGIDASGFAVRENEAGQMERVQELLKQLNVSGPQTPSGESLSPLDLIGLKPDPIDLDVTRSFRPYKEPKKTTPNEQVWDALLRKHGGNILAAANELRTIRGSADGGVSPNTLANISRGYREDVRELDSGFLKLKQRGINRFGQPQDALWPKLNADEKEQNVRNYLTQRRALGQDFSGQTGDSLGGISPEAAEMIYEYAKERVGTPNEAARLARAILADYGFGKSEQQQ